MGGPFQPPPTGFCFPPERPQFSASALQTDIWTLGQKDKRSDDMTMPIADHTGWRQSVLQRVGFNQHS